MEVFSFLLYKKKGRHPQIKPSASHLKGLFKIHKNVSTCPVVEITRNHASSYKMDNFLCRT